MVFNVCNGIVGNCEVYRLTFDGYRQISKCFKKSTTRHLACENRTYYETAPYIFENLPLKTIDFKADDSIEDMDVEAQYGEHESDEEFIVLNDNSDHEDMDSVSDDHPEIEVPDNSVEDMDHDTDIPENTSNQKEMVHPDDVFSIDSIPDKDCLLYTSPSPRD